MKRILLWLGIAICIELIFHLLYRILNTVDMEGSGESLWLMNLINWGLIVVLIIGVKFIWRKLTQLKAV